MCVCGNKISKFIDCVDLSQRMDCVGGEEGCVCGCGCGCVGVGVGSCESNEIKGEM